jgi:DNA-binding CsgD family transcriptional regulator
MLISRKSGTPLQVIVEPYISGLGDVRAPIAVTVSVRDPDKVRSAPARLYQALYGLTRAEARLAALIAEGRSLTEAAAMNGVTRETVRSQLKSVFQKTGANRQTELIRLFNHK